MFKYVPVQGRDDPFACFGTLQLVTELLRIVFQTKGLGRAPEGPDVGVALHLSIFESSRQPRASRAQDFDRMQPAYLLHKRMEGCSVLAGGSVFTLGRQAGDEHHCPSCGKGEDNALGC